jgi:hypothetical protein
MSKPVVCVPLVLLCLLCGPARFASAEHEAAFTADLGAIKPGSQSKISVGRVYVSQSRIRIETRDLPDGFFIVDTARPAAWFLRPRQRIFMDAKRSSPLTQIFVRVDPNDACREWQAMERVAGSPVETEWRCEPLGPDALGGTDTLKYQVVSRGKSGFRWVDPVRGFPIRVENPDGTVVTVEAIVDAPQAPPLFTVPANYRKFDPLQLIEQIKQSDVWVEPHR